MSSSPPNRSPHAATRPRSLTLIYGLAAGLCCLWAAITYDLDVWPPPHGRFDLFRWWPMYAFFAIIAVLGIDSDWGFVIPCTLLGVIAGNIFNPIVKSGSIESGVLETVEYMISSVIIGLAIGVILEFRRREKTSIDGLDKAPMSTAAQTPKPNRRWWQFRMRTRLVVMLLFVIGVNGIGSMYRAHENRGRVAAAEKVVAEIEELGGMVYAVYEDPSPQSWQKKLFDDPGRTVLSVYVVSFAGQPHVTDAELEHLERMATFPTLNLSDTHVTDAGLEHLKGLNLRRLNLSGTKVSDAGLEILKELTGLRALILHHTRVTDAGLAHVKEIKGLKSLDLSSTQVTGNGLEHLIDLTSLEHLDISGTRITDAGSMHLTGLKSLRVLYLIDTKVTDEGVKKLQQALPNCLIEH